MRPDPAEMEARLRRIMVESLRELSDRGEQERLWLSTGTDLKSGRTGLGARADAALIQSRAQLRKVNGRGDLAGLIASPQMDRVRALAAAALRLVEPRA